MAVSIATGSAPSAPRSHFLSTPPVPIPPELTFKAGASLTELDSDAFRSPIGSRSRAHESPSFWCVSGDDRPLTYRTDPSTPSPALLHEAHTYGTEASKKPI